VLIVDTNVLLDVVEDDPDWAEWSIRRMRDYARIHELAINPVIYAELSVAFDAMEDVDAVVAELALRVLDIPRSALFLAGKAFVRYRRLGGVKTNVLPDFFIGAHAAVMGSPILTRDPRRYESYFPTVDVIAPER